MQKKHGLEKSPYPNRVLLLEVVVKFLEEQPRLSVRTDLDELDAKLEIQK